MALAMAAAVSCALGAGAVAEPRAAGNLASGRPTRHVASGSLPDGGAPPVGSPAPLLAQGYPTALPDILPAPSTAGSGPGARGGADGSSRATLALARTAGRDVPALAEQGWPGVSHAAVELGEASEFDLERADGVEPVDPGGPPNPLDGLTPLVALGTSRYEATVALHEDGVDSGELRVLLEYSEESAAQRLQVLFVDVSGAETVRVDELGVASRWYSYTGDPDNPWTLEPTPADRDAAEYLGGLSWLVDPRLIVGAAQAESMRQERLHGEAVVRLHFSEAAIRQEWLDSLDLPPADEVSVDVWISEEHGALLALEVTAVCGTGAGSTRLVTRGALSDVGGIVPVREPQVCSVRPLPEDVPLVDGAAHLSDHCGSWLYETSLSAQTVADYYAGTMQERGWTLREEESFAPAYLEFHKGETQLSVRTDGSGAITYVILASMPAGEG